MTDQFVFTTTHELFFSNREPVPIKEIVESLLGIERIIKMSPKALHAITGVEIDHAEVFVDQLASGSLLEKLGIRLVFKSEQELEAFADWVRENIVRKPGVGQALLIGTVIAALIGLGMHYLAAPAGGNTTNITANNNVIMTIGAGETSLSPEQFRSVVEAAVSSKKELASATALVLKPARLDPEASLKIDGREQLRISPEAIKATPHVLEIQPDEWSEDLPDVDLQIRATNLDNPSRGWAALIPGRVDRRVRMELNDGVSPRDVAGRFQVRADVTVHYKRQPSGKKYLPVLIQVRQVIRSE